VKLFPSMLDSEKFKIIRRTYKLNMEEFADLLGISASYVCQIEKGKSSLSVNVAQKLIDELELTQTKLEKILEVHRDFTLNS
jgi:transcriptional regulator with XRE-family HTH domain